MMCSLLRSDLENAGLGFLVAWRFGVSRIGPDLCREQIEPDAADLTAGNTQLVDRQRRGERVGQLEESATWSQEIETGNDDGLLRSEREPFDRQAGDDRAQPFDPAGEIFADSRCVALDHSHSWKLATQHRHEAWLSLESKDALGRTAGTHEAARQTACPGPELEHRAWPQEVYITGDCVCETRAARIGGGNAQRLLQPEAEEDRCVRDHLIARVSAPEPILPWVLRGRERQVTGVRACDGLRCDRYGSSQGIGRPSPSVSAIGLK